MLLLVAGPALVPGGVFTALGLGTGSFLLPAITRGTDTASVAEGAAWRRSMILHLVGAALWISAAFVEPLYSVRLAFAIRGAVTAAVLIGTTRLWRPPSMPGLHRWLTWVSGWMLPLGSFIVAIDPGLRRGGLHVTLIGCFALLVLSVGAHVSLSHGGRPSLLSKRPWQLWIVAALVAAALAARLCIDAFPALALVWFAIAAGAFLASTIVWSTLALVPQRKPLS
ncbi:MAG: NnrS family protein [Deltaproteobacteria bacterium]|nr:NnrS family protein [Deltaproteobacteria bacterium]